MAPTSSRRNAAPSTLPKGLRSPSIHRSRSRSWNRSDHQSPLTRRTQENFKHLWEQWSQRSNELLKGVGRSRSVGDAPGNPEQVLDAVFDFAENLVAQQRAFAKQMLHAASQGQQSLADVANSPVGRTTGPAGVAVSSGTPASPTTTGPAPSGTAGS